MTVTDVEDNGVDEDTSSKQEQVGDAGHMSMLEIIDDLKQPTDRYIHTVLLLL